MRIPVVSSIALCLFVVWPLQAHDLYLRPSAFQAKAGQSIRVEYHNGGSFPRSEVPVKVDRLRQMEITSPGGKIAFTGIHVEGNATIASATAPIDEGSFLFLSRTLPNFIELDAAKFEEYLLHEGLDHIVAWRKDHGESAKPGREMYSKYVKGLGFVGASSGYTRPAGLKIEFVPLSDPYKLKLGEDLPVRVLVDGKAMEGLRVEAARAWQDTAEEKIIGRTDAKGEIRVPASGPGLYKLHTIYMERCKNTQQADWESFWASLTFELPR